MDLRHAFSQLDAALSMLSEEYGVVTTDYDIFVKAAEKHSVDFDAFDPTIYPLAKIFTLTSLTFILENQFKLHHVLSMFVHHIVHWRDEFTGRDECYLLTYKSVTIGHQELLRVLLEMSDTRSVITRKSRFRESTWKSSYLLECIAQCIDDTYTDSLITIVRTVNCSVVKDAYHQAIKLRSKVVLEILLDAVAASSDGKLVHFNSQIDRHIAQYQYYDFFLALLSCEWRHRRWLGFSLASAMVSNCGMLASVPLVDSFLLLILAIVNEGDDWNRVYNVHHVAVTLMPRVLTPDPGCSEEIAIRYLKHCFDWILPNVQSHFGTVQLVLEALMQHTTTIEAHKEEYLALMEKHNMLSRWFSVLHVSKYWNDIFLERNIYDNASIEQKTEYWRVACLKGKEMLLSENYNVTLEIVIEVIRSGLAPERLHNIITLLLRQDLSSISLDDRKRYLTMLIRIISNESTLRLLMMLIQAPHNWKLDSAQIVAMMVFHDGNGGMFNGVRYLR